MNRRRMELLLALALSSCAGTAPAPVPAPPPAGKAAPTPTDTPPQVSTGIRARPTIRVETSKAGVEVVVTAPDGVESLGDVRFSVGANTFCVRGCRSATFEARAKDVFPAKWIRFDGDAMRQMLFRPGMSEPIDVVVNVTYMNADPAHPGEWKTVGGLVDAAGTAYATDELKPLYERWIAETMEAAIPDEEITSGKCAEKRARVLNEAVATLKTDLAAGAWSEVRLVNSSLVAAKPAGTAIELPTGAGKGDVHVCAFGFDDPGVRVEKRVDSAAKKQPPAVTEHLKDLGVGESASGSESPRPSTGCTGLVKTFAGMKVGGHITRAAPGETLKGTIAGRGCTAVLVFRAVR